MTALNNIVHIALAANHRYLPGLEATLSSIIVSASDRSALQFHVFSEGLYDEDKTKLANLARKFGLKRDIDFITPDMSPIAKFFKPFKDSYTAFLRIFLCDFLPDLDWIVYSDVDTLWFRDICELWRERDDSVSALWCKDCPSAAMFVHEYSKAWNPDFDESRYCCSGVMLMNLKRMRQKRLPEECSAFARKWGSTFFPDQDILNHVLRDDEKHLDQRWDCMMPDPRALEGVVVHCNGVGQFFNGPYDSWRVLYNIWFEYYFEVIKGEKFPLPLSKRLVFAAMGLFYPPRWMIRLFTWPFHLCRTDQIWRTFFFSWLRLRLERLRRG